MLFWYLCYVLLTWLCSHYIKLSNVHYFFYLKRHWRYNNHIFLPSGIKFFKKYRALARIFSNIVILFPMRVLQRYQSCAYLWLWKDALRPFCAVSISDLHWSVKHCSVKQWRLPKHESVKQTTGPTDQLCDSMRKLCTINKLINYQHSYLCATSQCSQKCLLATQWLWFFKLFFKKKSK